MEIQRFLRRVHSQICVTILDIRHGFQEGFFSQTNEMKLEVTISCKGHACLGKF